MTAPHYEDGPVQVIATRCQELIELADNEASEFDFGVRHACRTLINLIEELDVLADPQHNPADRGDDDRDVRQIVTGDHGATLTPEPTRAALLSVLEEFDPGGWFDDPRIDGWVARIRDAVTATSDPDALEYIPPFEETDQ